MASADQRREYQREWSRKNRDKVKEYRKNTAIRRAISEINAGEVVVVRRLVNKHEAINSEED